jgi:hypothetical protein
VVSKFDCKCYPGGWNSKEGSPLAVKSQSHSSSSWFMEDFDWWVRNTGVEPKEWPKYPACTKASNLTEI